LGRGRAADDDLDTSGGGAKESLASLDETVRATKASFNESKDFSYRGGNAALGLLANGVAGLSKLVGAVGSLRSWKEMEVSTHYLYGPRKRWTLTGVAIEGNDAQDIRSAALRDAEETDGARVVGTAAPLLNIDGGSSDADGEKGDGSEELHLDFWWEDEPKCR
jgi:hypothetical protein